jgi:hypothetical protein
MDRRLSDQVGDDSPSPLPIWLEAKVLTLAPLAAVALRAPELVASGALGDLLLDTLVAAACSIVLAAAVRVVRAIIE